MKVDECQIALMQYKLETENQETNLAKQAEKKKGNSLLQLQVVTLVLPEDGS